MYLIVHRASGRAYVGSTTNLSKRWSRHRAGLIAGTHKNRHLQAAWNLYGPGAFDWRVLAVIEPSQRIWLEQRAIDVLHACNPEYGFNKEATAGATRGRRGQECSPTHRQRLSESNKAAKPAHQVGSRCPQGHIKDGTYLRRKANGTVKVRCQECERGKARDRQRQRLGIPLDRPPGNYKRRERDAGG